MPIDYDKYFPALRRSGFTQTSKAAYYNCVAYCVGDLKRFWWPGEYHPKNLDDYWPPNAPNEETLGAFTTAFATVGFMPCAGGELEREYEKIALYASEGLVSHSAKQMPDGRWRSKLGLYEDIEHKLEGLVSPSYGSVIAFFKRPRTEDLNQLSGCLFGWLLGLFK